MRLYRVVVKYAKSSTARKALYEAVYQVEAGTASHAADQARANLREENPKWAIHKVKVTKIVEIGFVNEKALIQNGEMVSVRIEGQVQRVSDDRVAIVSKNGAKIHMKVRAIENQLGRQMAPLQTVEYWSVYPSGQVYVRDFGPVRNSSYDLDDLVQLKITKVNGKIVKKEIV